jgi:hypothetical protein
MRSIRLTLRALGMGALLAAPTALRAQRAATTVSADTLRVHLFAIADDSMGGRGTGSPGDEKAADWVAAAFARYGLAPAGENGGFFQTVPLWRVALDTASGLEVGGTHLKIGRDVLPMGINMTWKANGAATIFGGVATDSTTWPVAEQIAGKLVVMQLPPGGDWRAATRAMLALRRNPRFRDVAGFAFPAMDLAPPDLAEQMTAGRVTPDTLVFSLARGSLLVTPSAASALLGVPLATATPGLVGPVVTGAVAFGRFPLDHPARNVIGILPGSDAALRGTYVSISAHNDHIGFSRPPVDHDSTRAFNRVVRPMGEDSPLRPATAEEAARVAALRDSLRSAHPARLDSVNNGADDDGSGTVALVELARVLASGPRPRRSILFISHVAEERGLLGSRWFTDHPTVIRDSIIAEIDVDMIGRGDAADLPRGGPGYLEVVGSRRLSTELGNLVDTVAAREPQPFHLNYEYDAPGHPLQYYCRADHYSYARYGIPSVSLSTGEHLDYHQVTDEPQYIDYAQLARVTSLVRDLAIAAANLDHRPVVDGRRRDPRAPCAQ